MKKFIIVSLFLLTACTATKYPCDRVCIHAISNKYSSNNNPYLYS